jgi:phospholipase/carboxylesterase
VPTRIESQTTYERGWIFRVRPAKLGQPDRVFVWIHGWTGDENSMEIFSRGIPENNYHLFPRGPVQSPSGGYGWVADRTGTAGLLSDYAPAATSLLGEIDLRLREIGLHSPSLTLCGFSQGAAMTYALLLLFPMRIERAAALAGFMPGYPTSLDGSALKSKPVYIAHGTRDETIPVDEARRAASALSGWGADVEYCENSGGHKLPPSCFTQLTRFLLS